MARNLKLKFSPQFQDDVRVARAWWKANRNKAPKLLGEELRRAFALLKSQRTIGERALDVEAEGIRRLYLRGTRHFIYYEVHESEIEVLRLWHSTRGEPPNVRSGR